MNQNTRISNIFAKIPPSKKNFIIQQFDLPTIADRLEMIRWACGLTQSQLAKIMGVSRQSICHYENGITTPTYNPVLRAEQLLRINPEWLYSYHGDCFKTDVEQAERSRAIAS
jgi:DNA-binding XRE family transcriptional regulator